MGHSEIFLGVQGEETDVTVPWGGEFEAKTQDRGRWYSLCSFFSFGLWGCITYSKIKKIKKQRWSFRPHPFFFCELGMWC